MVASKRRSYALAVHGGAGTISRAEMTDKREKEYQDALREALSAGKRELERDGSSVDAVTAAVVALENNPLFNAGRGAVFNTSGEHELDAAVMDGATLQAGAVAAARRIRNPVLAARAVMEQTKHVLLSADGADRFARSHGLRMVAQEYFSTRARRVALELARAKKRGIGSPRASAAERHGTVGAVAYDHAGNLAAATSTGGFTNKMQGRVGDTPLIGAGTYANNAFCAVSATGDGEFFIRSVLAYDVCARMRYGGQSLALAARNALETVKQMGGEGGLVAIDRHGRVVMPFNSEGMYRACVKRDGKVAIAIYR